VNSISRAGFTFDRAVPSPFSLSAAATAGVKTTASAAQMAEIRTDCMTGPYGGGARKVARSVVNAAYLQEYAFGPDVQIFRDEWCKSDACVAAARDHSNIVT
jgi:hypothetical protein